MQKTLRIKNDIHELSMMNQFLEEAGEELGLSTAFMTVSYTHLTLPTIA